MTTHSESQLPAVSQTRPLTRWGMLSLAALTGGVWAYATPDTPFPITEWLMPLALLLGGWLPWWRALAYTDWATPLARWRTWENAIPIAPLPYTQPGTPGAALTRALALARHWWRAVGYEALHSPLRQAGLALALSLLLAALQGRAALLLTLLFLAWSELAVLWHGGRGQPGSGWTAFALVGIPWLLGSSLSAAGLGAAGPAALAITVLVGSHAHASLLAVVGPLTGAAFLLWQGHALAAGWLLLLALPGLNLLRRRPGPDDYQRALLPWLLAMIGVMAEVL